MKSNLTSALHTTVISGLLLLGYAQPAIADNIVFAPGPGAFRIADSSGAAPVLVAQGEAEVLRIGAELFASDVEQVVGTRPAILTTPPSSGSLIIVGTLSENPWLRELAERNKIDTRDLAGQWESSRNFLVNDPFPGVTNALVIVGSDRRGAAYGLLELSRDMGVSPWVWWADATPTKRTAIYYNNGPRKQLGPPSVKYRGIFINDEDWSLIPWIKQTFDPETGNIGPKTYEKVFELMLRLRSNYIWPAMHRCSLPFNAFSENAVLADRYAIVGGSSHCEPLLRNGVTEWKLPKNQWNYFTHPEEVKAYWEETMKIRGVYENFYTLGMRGLHDSGMPGSSDRMKRVRKMEELFADQQAILEEHTGKPAAELPMVFCPYKEVLEDYDAGLVVPEDITICWAEDNQGYVRRMPDAKERARSGGHGIYYHLSYWSDYLWLSSIAPQLMALELTRAYDYDVRKLWVVNVGDIKVAEKETQFFMDLAWDIGAWSEGRAHQWAEQWATDTFGTEHGTEIGHILNEFYRLAWRGKPEHIGHTVYPDNELKQRLADYHKIANQASTVRAKVPEYLQSVYFQLVYYPVVAAKFHNDKVLLARMCNRETARGNEKQALAYSRKARSAWEEVKTLTAEYNDQSDGKWKGLMSWNPRDLRIFSAPDTSPEGFGSFLDATPLDLTKVSVVSPMAYEEGILGGTAPGLQTTESGGDATLTFHSDKAEKKLLLALANMPTVKEDSFFFRLNNSKWLVVNEQVTGDDWSWLPVGEIEVRKGMNTLNIRQREPNARIKQVSLAPPGQNLKRRPHGITTAMVKELMQEPDQVITLNDPHQLRPGKAGTSIRVEEGLSIDGRAAYLVPNTAEPIPSDEQQAAPAIEFKP